MRRGLTEVLSQFLATSLVVLLLFALGWEATSHILRIIEERALPQTLTLTQGRPDSVTALRTVTRVVTVTETLGSGEKVVTKTVVLNVTTTVTRSVCGRLTIVITRPITRVPFTLVVNG